VVCVLLCSVLLHCCVALTDLPRINRIARFFWLKAEAAAAAVPVEERAVGPVEAWAAADREAPEWEAAVEPEVAVEWAAAEPAAEVPELQDHREWETTRAARAPEWAAAAPVPAPADRAQLFLVENMEAAPGSRAVKK
jgi:hypothetical protein